MTPVSPPLQILLLEAEPMRRALLERLNNAGYAVSTARNAPDAMSQLADGTFQILLVDWELPGLDGFGLCQTVRSLDPPHYIYIVSLTSDANADGVGDLEAGPDEFVTKPIAEVELLARVHTARRIVRLEHSLRDANLRIDHMSMTDAALGIYNRRYLYSHLQREIERAQRYERALSVLVCDMDGLKDLSESHGRTIGEEVLKHFVSLAAGQLRPSDWIARYGGEEIAIVLPETPSEGAMVTAEKIRDSLARTPVPTSAGALKITATFGVSTMALDDDDENEGEDREPADVVASNLIANADAALRSGKKRGRNQTVMA